MSFHDYLGNEPTVRLLRESLAAGRLPHAILLGGPRGVGKYTLALMVAQAANCLTPPAVEADPNGLPDFCGTCTNCVRIAAAAPLRDRVEEAVAAREELRDADKKETRILVQTHPDVIVVPPDPPQLLIKLGQVRTVIREIYRIPAEARRSFFIFTSSSFMKEAANSLLKVLEEPPAHATIMLLSDNPMELLPTIRSRTAAFTLGALPAETVEALLAARRPEWKPAQRALVARLSEGAPGAALAFNLPAYEESRTAALLVVRGALRETDYSALFRMTEAFRAGAEGQQKTSALLRALRSLLRDLMLIHAGQSALLRNLDIARELTTLAEAITFPWLERAVRSVDEVETGMRRNLLRSLSLDAMAGALAQSTPS
ncbi:DNA polymerase III subunit delta' [Acidipila sp. EB88]|uniref:DNA polymerase III subunit n=1 Tax=Acidipila sp. EB88 TaxID=2305226 RepID=UPI000F5F027F|nr:DNA polymerase III subunit delta' [Acidipila sp. EB88]RRA47188.1 DNA polymerase III subunit delta' [Acidipila sp. EB88]